MMRGDLLNLTFSDKEVKHKTSAIYNQVLDAGSIDAGNYTLVSSSDLRLLFELYDRMFFKHFFENYRESIFFHLSTRMIKSAGKTHYNSKTGDFVVSLSTALLFQTFNDSREVKVNGVICHDRLEATMRVFEHEIVHVVEYVLFGDLSCSKHSFKRLAGNIFSHTEVTHQLITRTEIAHKDFNLHVGDKVYFEYDGKTYKGFINRITKRATFMSGYVNLKRFFDLEKVEEAWMTIGDVWEFGVVNCPEMLKIRVIENPDGSYTGIANYKIQRTDQDEPYISMNPQKTKEEAIWDSLNGFLTYWDPSIAKQIKLIPNEHYY